MRTKINNKTISVDDNLSYAHAVSDNNQFTRCSVRELIETAAAESKDRIAFIFPNNFELELTYQDVELKSKHLAQNLLNMGFKKGDRLAIAVDNTHEVIITFLASAIIGVVTTLFSPNFKVFEFEHLLKKTGTRGLLIFDSIGERSYFETIKKLCPEIESSQKGQLNSSRCPELKHIIVINRSLSVQNEEGQSRPSVKENLIRYPGCWSYEDLATEKIANVNGGDDCEWPYIQLDDLLLITFTSGTTGTPKGATHKHFSMLNNAFINKTILDSVLNERKMITCNGFPMMHIGLPGVVFLALVNQLPMLFPFKNFNASEAIKAIGKYKCYGILASPRMLDEIITHPDVDKFDFSELKLIYTGGSLSTIDLGLRYQQKFKITHFFNGYGSSEAGGIITQNMWNLEDPNLNKDSSVSSIGYPNAFIEIKIVDPNSGEIVPLNQDGILYSRGFPTMAKYWDEPEKTREALDENGWLNSGDLVSMANDGCIFYKSRVKETIKIYDHSIYPFEVESYLNKHPNVEESCVFGIKVGQYEEAVCAWIKLKDKSSGTTIEDIKAFCKENFADTKAPKYIKFIDEFTDKTSLGKLQRVRMADLFKQELKL